MSDDLLPDDLAQWPEDPNELFGVSFGVTPRELRRAYNRLIRIYKPEQFPEQFRRIREAYESLLRIAQWYAVRPQASDTPSTEEPPIPPAPKKQSSSDDIARRNAESNPPEEDLSEEIISVPAQRPEAELDKLWESAIAGRPSTASERLVQLTQQHAGRVEFYQRLYWLLTLWPNPDAPRVPADWLVQGLLATGLAGPLRELYREVVADDPAEAFRERYESLLEAATTSELLADLIEWRFQAAIRLQRWDVLDADLPRLGQRFGIGEEQLWLRLVFLLSDGTAWATDAAGERLLAACRAEIARYEHIASSMSYAFDRFDLLLEAAAGWRKLSHWDGVLLTIWRLRNKPINAFFSNIRHRRVPTVILRLIGISWSRPFSAVRGSLLEVLEAIAGAPQRWLEYLDQMDKRAPATLALFGELLDQLEAEREEEARYDQDWLNGIVLPFLSRFNVANLASYETIRKRMLRFCIDENIAPEEVAEISSALAQQLMADWPLRYVCRACRLFWA